ncbi:MAG: proton-conducting transporter membrane subunit [Bacteroidales bacterium]
MGFEGFGSASDFLLLHLVFLVAGIFLVLILNGRFRIIAVISTVFITAVLTSVLALKGLKSGNPEIILYGGSFLGEVPVRIDGLSSWFILLINFVSVTAVLYGTGYLRSYKASRGTLALHWVSFLLFQSSMFWVCSVQNGLAFILVWEVMSLSSLFLVIFNSNDGKVVRAGINYLVQMHLSVVLLTIAFLWAYVETGTFDFKGIERFFTGHSNIWLFLIFLAGFGFKSGFLGLHTWLPHAHPAAPSHISGIMSGVIVKMGIYGIIRVSGYLSDGFMMVGTILILLSMLTGIYGIMNSSVQRDLKKMLAYCTIENIGIIGIGIGLGIIGKGLHNDFLFFLGFGGALLHVLNHSLIKSLLFFAAGSVYMQTHTREIERLGGLGKQMPHTAGIFLAGSLAIAGIPPLNGFISEFLVYFGLFKGMMIGNSVLTIMFILVVAGLCIIGGISIISFSKSFSIIFLGSPRTRRTELPREVSPLMLLPQYLTLGVMLAVVVFPGLFIRPAASVLSQMTGDVLFTDFLQDIVPLANQIGLFSLGLIGLVAIGLLMKSMVNRRLSVKENTTWGCAYEAPSARMQYTGKSFSKNLGKLTNSVLPEKKLYNELHQSEVFPLRRKHYTLYVDVMETRVVDPLLKIIRQLIHLFNFVQNGRIQAYVLYGIVFILLVFFGSLIESMF